MVRNINKMVKVFNTTHGTIYSLPKTAIIIRLNTNCYQKLFRNVLISYLKIINYAYSEMISSFRGIGRTFKRGV